MKKFNFNSKDSTLRSQFLLVITVLLIIPVLVMMYDIFFATRSDEVMLKDREEKLGSVIETVVAPNIKQQFSQALGSKDIDSLSVKERVVHLKQAFDNSTRDLVPSNPGVRFGLYIPETGQIFVNGFLHQYRELNHDEQLARERRVLKEANSGLIAVAASGKPLARLTSSLNDETFEYLSPVFIENKLVAVAWADERLHPIYAQSRLFRLLTRYFTLLALFFGGTGAILIIHNLASGVSRIKEGLSKMEKDIHYHIPELYGEAGQIARAINKMASSLVEKEKLEEELRRSERLAALGRLVTGVAHELRNPIGVIKTTMQIMENDLKTVPGAEVFFNEPAKIIYEQINRQNRVLQELLDFGRPSKQIIQSASINSLLEKILTFTSPMLREHNIKLVTNFDQKLPAVKVDAERIKQVFVNLILNGIQAMPESGTLTIRTYSIEDWVCIDFIDTGKGISPDEIGCIFDPFFTTKEYGTGLGLSISHQIIKAHGGVINVESTEGIGTIFTVKLHLDGEMGDEADGFQNTNY
ncbi:ATP-binding protein [Desulfotruncus alcoholivorax]|uniref:ATP-binding protein n=1 Tax=Desulfotruncus alcoholivorax TaxID=265477 RepID=UPI0004146625|nr:ATP-binding protein [Desulfotruncus alcoholivorax]